MFLGIDLGTSGVKVALVDDCHAVHGMADAPLGLQHPHPLWSEQHPDDWWQALQQAVDTLRRQAPKAFAAVRGIGLSGQMHGAVVLDASRAVLRPAMLWNDGRAFAECAELERRVPQSRQITGNLAMAGFTAPKLVWLQRHEPSVFERIRTVLLPKDWLRLQLTGEAVSDLSDASGTLWLDVEKRRWSPDMLAACDLSESHMPRLVEGSDVSGVLRPECASAWGLAPGVVVAGGAGDNAASAIGIGAAQPGEGFVSLGTSGVIFLVGDGYRCAPQSAVHSFAHALPGRWHQMSVMLSAASAFGWVTQLTGCASESVLAAQVHGLSPERRLAAPIFLPYLSGERTPHNNPQASGSFVGLRSEHTAADLGYAVMEGVTFGLMDGWFAMGQPARSTTPMALVGGGAQSDAWAQMIASGLGCPLQRPQGAGAAAALGAARLGWLALGGTQAAVCQALPTQRRFEPDAAQCALLESRHARFQALYPALKALF